MDGRTTFCPTCPTPGQAPSPHSTAPHPPVPTHREPLRRSLEEVLGTPLNFWMSKLIFFKRNLLNSIKKTTGKRPFPIILPLKQALISFSFHRKAMLV